jgi:hypothetical protein
VDVTGRGDDGLIPIMKNIALALLLSITGLAAGCGGHNLYSSPVGVNLHAQSGDVSSGTITQDKMIISQSGNPYATFLAAARAKFGKDPSDVGVGGLTLVLGAGSTGVTLLEQVFTGQVDVLFWMQPGSGNSFSVGHVVNPTGIGPVNLNVDFNSSNVTGLDHAALMSGNFRVVIRGSAAGGFALGNANADLQNTFTFNAAQ